MRAAKSILTLVFTATMGALLAGCPPTAEATRDGGQPCSNTEQCNPPGQSCGEIVLCVQGFCSSSTVIRTCEEGGYPDGPALGECQAVEDCNGGQTCGELIVCINSQCARDAGRMSVACPEAGTDAAADSARPDANAVDAAVDAGSTDATVVDAGPGFPDGFPFPG